MVRVLILALVMAVGLAAPASAVDRPGLRAVLDGAPILAADIPAHHCHDLAYPTIRCFDTRAELEADEASMAAMTANATGSAAPASLLPVYVTWYMDSNYGGMSFDASYSYADLSPLNWNDRISSFKSLYNSRPVWFWDANYGGASTWWPRAAWVSYVGDQANDKFSSVTLPN
jgi:hypothetical protein